MALAPVVAEAKVCLGADVDGALPAAARASQLVQANLNAHLPKVYRPGVAYDVGKLRDVVAEIETQYAGCERP